MRLPPKRLFISKAATPRPLAAPEPASPIKCSLPMLLANKLAPTNTHVILRPAKKYESTVFRLFLIMSHGDKVSTEFECQNLGLVHNFKLKFSKHINYDFWKIVTHFLTGHLILFQLINSLIAVRRNVFTSCFLSITSILIFVMLNEILGKALAGWNGDLVLPFSHLINYFIEYSNLITLKF
ncbi:hypothetical protein BpHYR1_012915 [Brachionus plicatilis]|uniref:Uncharacterized protein n=1 Tax=Brachionus plicatilis TaxID=10195 RepID=A0A3M7P9E5_BRAPC|nr:hypothetical protein BpHYR1_012915 [Brachionus plicatilis]